jgi:hypothetical protein
MNVVAVVVVVAVIASGCTRHVAVVAINLSRPAQVMEIMAVVLVGKQ